jgi:hypothetical protein
LRAKKKKVINMIIFGGLGNQLFQYFAGQYLAYKAGAVLKIDSTFSQFGRSGHSDWVGETTLPGYISPSAPSHSLRYFRSLIKRRFREFLGRIIQGEEMKLRVLRQYHSPAPGYDSQLEHLKPPVTVVGYFQSWRYFQALSDSGLVPEVKMKNPSRWILDMTGEMSRQGKILGIHVRRGDYVGNAGIGTLSVSYYEAAAQELRSRGANWDAVWIFSDDSVRVEKEFEGFLDGEENLVFVKPPSESHAFESLLLLSQSSFLVIANSTFSWWAATLGNCKVYSPVVGTQTGWLDVDFLPNNDSGTCRDVQDLKLAP